MSLSSTLTHAKTFSVMSYNVENLFDTKHDKGKNDYTYLPLAVKNASPEIQTYCNSLARRSWKNSCLYTDWNEEVLKIKIANAAKVIKAYNFKRGADVVVVQEVENKSVLTRLVNEGLRGKGYKYISLIEGPDSRGIDVGIISKYPIVEEKLHLVDLSGIGKNTRGILEVTIKVENEFVTIFGNHWPSQGNISETRLEAAKVLLENALNSISSLVIATGDFNTLDKDEPHGINTIIRPAFTDTYLLAKENGNKLHAGTHWWGGDWTAIDKMFVLKANSNKKLKLKSLKIIKKKFMLGEKKWTNRDTGEVTIYKNIPKRFDYKKREGYSDHLPLVMKFKI